MANKLIKNTLLLSVGMLLTKGINFIMIPLFSSWLSTSDYGSFDLLCTYSSLLVPFLSLASSEALFRFGIDSENDKELSSYITTSFVIDAVGFMIAMAAVLLLVAFNDWSLGLCFIPLFFGELWMNHFQGVLRANKKLDVYSACQVLTTFVIAVATTVYVLVFGWGLAGITLGYASGYICGCVAIFIFSKYWKYLSFSSLSKDVLKELLAYSGPLIPNNVSWWVINVSDRTFIGLFINTAANGIYAIASKVPNLCASVFGVFSLSWQESASEMVDAKERNAYYNRVYNSTVLTMLSLSAGVLALNYPLFAWIFDQRYSEAALYVPILVTAVAFNSFALFFGGIQISLKRPKENGVTTVVGAVANVVLNLIFIPLMGIWAAALSTLAADMLIAALRWFKLKGDISFKLNRRTYLAIVLYVVFFAASYLCTTTPLFLIDLILTGIYFLWANKTFVTAALAKVKRK